MRFQLKDNENIVEIKVNEFGKETLLFNNEVIVSKKTGFFNKSVHTWYIGKDHYILSLKIGFFNGKIELFKNSQSIDIIQGKSGELVKLGYGKKKTKEEKDFVNSVYRECFLTILFCALFLLEKYIPTDFKTFYIVASIPSFLFILIFLYFKKK
jgi:hypothetical protein